MSKVVIIGAGASGMIAGIMASENNEVIILERNDKCGKKILLTGNGRCNYWNSSIDSMFYHTDCLDNLNNILKSKNTVFDYLTKFGIYPKIKNGYYYPNSNQASSVREILCKELERKNVKIVYNCKVENIIKKDDKFIVSSDETIFECDKVIVATGGSSSPKTGTDGSLFELLSKYHAINTVLPSLVPLVGDGNYFKEWNNIRVDAKVSLYVNNSLLDSEEGELQLTDYGISGIPTFNISGLVSKGLYANNKTIININFLPEIEDVYNFIESRCASKDMEDTFESVLPYQLVFVLLKLAGINKDDIWDNLDEDKRKKLVSLINAFELEITDTLSFDRSQVSTGGVSLKEINPSTMESLNVKGLYLIGEVLDVDGKCGGFNLAFSFITGYIAGSNL